MNGSKSIKNWLEDDRPREKMLHKSAAALTDAELLAILISSGTRERSALDLARDILELGHNNLQELGRLTITELQKIKGIGEARAITICAAMELGRRRQLTDAPERMTMDSIPHVARVVRAILQDHVHEVFCVLYLNNANKLLKQELVSAGNVASTTVDTKMIIKNCLLYNASKMILAHNHPSGSRQPSEHDRILTQKLKDAARLMDIQLVDHIIIAGNEFYSFANERLL